MTAGAEGPAAAGAGAAVSDEQPRGPAPGGRGRRPEPVLADHLVLGLRARRPAAPPPRSRSTASWQPAPPSPGPQNLAGHGVRLSVC